MFVKEHLNILKEFNNDHVEWKGFNTLRWAGYFMPMGNLNDAELNRSFSRETLLDYCSEPKTADENAVLAVLSWGGMRKDHGQRLFIKKNEWLETITELRNGSFNNRYEAYRSFKELRNAGSVPGLGIAYFTKLICFLRPELNGYILDQWTGKSINLLTGQNVVSVSKTGWIKDDNDADVYERYCSYIEHLSAELKCTPMEAEEKIFSAGRGKGRWRNYLIDNIIL